jgi:hypothetical protein
MAIDYTMSQCFWMIGDVCVDLVESVNRERSKQLGKIISKQDIFEAVGLFCRRTGRSTRYYYECAKFFSPETRQKYDVPFTVFAVARWTDDWEAVLKIASENPIWSADRVRTEFYKQIGEEPPTREKQLPNTTEVDDSEEKWNASYKDVLLNKLEHTTDDLRQVLDRVPLPVEIRVRIGDVLLEIQDIGLLIRREA